MIPEPRSRLGFWIAAILLLGAPFAPDLFEGRKAKEPWILSWNGRDFILPILGTAAAALTGAWDRSRESGRLSWIVAFWALAMIIAAFFAPTLDRGYGRVRSFLVPAALVGIGSVLAWLATLLLRREPEPLAEVSRSILGALALAQSVHPFIDGQSIAYPLAGAGLALIVAEVFETLAVKNDGRLIR